MLDNPYTPPKAEIEIPLDVSEAEAYRKMFLPWERRLRLLAGFYTMVGIVSAVVSVQIVSRAFRGDPVLWFFWSFPLLSLGYFVAASGLRRCRMWGCGCAILLGVYGATNFPVGTIFHVAVLTFLLLPGCRAVFTQRYAQARQLTSSLKAKVAVWEWILMFLLIAILGWTVRF
jgi:hypothetical protein